METTSSSPIWLDNALENEEISESSPRSFLWHVQAGNNVACGPSNMSQNADVLNHQVSVINEEHGPSKSAADCGHLDFRFVEDLLLSDDIEPANPTFSCHDVWAPDDVSAVSEVQESASLTCGGTVGEFVNPIAVTHLPSSGEQQLLQITAIGDEGHGGENTSLSSAGDHLFDATSLPEELLEPRHGFLSSLSFESCDTSDLRSPGLMEDPSRRTSSRSDLQESTTELRASGEQMPGLPLSAQSVLPSSVSSSGRDLLPSSFTEKDIPDLSEVQQRSQHRQVGLARDGLMSRGTMGGDGLRQILPWHEQLGCSWSSPLEHSEEAVDAMAARQGEKCAEGTSSWDVLGVPDSQAEQHRLRVCSPSAGAAAVTAGSAGMAADCLEVEFEVKGSQASWTKYESNMGEGSFRLSGSIEIDTGLLPMQRQRRPGRQQEVHSPADGDMSSSQPAREAAGADCPDRGLACKQRTEGKQRRHLLELEGNGTASQTVSDGGGDDGRARRTVPNLSLRLASIIDNLGQKHQSGGGGGGLKGTQDDGATGCPEAREDTGEQGQLGSHAEMQSYVPLGAPAATPLPKRLRKKRPHEDFFSAKGVLAAQAEHVPPSACREGNGKQPAESTYRAFCEEAQEILQEWTATQELEQSMHMRILVAVDSGKKRFQDHEDWQQKMSRKGYLHPASGSQLNRIVPRQLSASQAHPSVYPGKSALVLSLEGVNRSGPRALRLNGPRLYTESEIKENLLALATAHVTFDEGKVTALERTLLPYANRWGSGLQRLCFHFLNALRMRTRGMGEAGSSSGYFKRWLAPVANSANEQEDQDNHLAGAARGPDLQEETSEALTDAKVAYFATTPFIRWFFTATSTVLLRMIGLRKRIHVIDFGYMLGAQWIQLIGQLKSRACGPPTSFRITTVVNQARNELGPPSMCMREKEVIAALHQDLERAAECAGIKEFEFKVVFVEPTIVMELWTVQGRRQASSSSQDQDDQEFLAVRSCMDLEVVPDSSVVRANPRDAVLMWVRSLEPEVFLLMGQELDGNNPFFLSRCRGCLDFYASAFNCHDQTVLGTTSKALLFEEYFHGIHITNVIACEGLSRIARGEQEGQWRARLKRLGFHVMEGGFDATLQDELYGIVRDGPEGWGMKVSQGAVEFLWKGRSLVFISLWHA